MVLYTIIFVSNHNDWGNYYNIYILYIIPLQKLKDGYNSKIYTQLKIYGIL